jgi:hypothetical protein
MRGAARVGAALLFVLKAGLIAGLIASTTSASAKSAREVSYGYDQVWPALVRFLRVDENLKLTEKDPAAGYILFELADGKRTFAGAAELARTSDATGRAATRIVVRIADRPAYMESGILDRFADKLREELGAPPPAPPASQPAPPSQPGPPPEAPPQGDEKK